MTPNGGRTLSRLAAQVSEDVCVVEVGVYMGDSLAYLAAATAGPVFGVDPWDLRGGPPRAAHVRNPLNMAAAAAKTSRFGNVTLIRGFSVDVAASWPYGPVGLLHVDGKHTYRSVRDDYEAWRPHVVGVVVFDDYDHPKYPGVKRAVDELGPVEVVGRHAILR